mgnify:CR=1 FL=1
MVQVLNLHVDLKKRLSYFINQINDKNDINQNIGVYKSLEREITLYHAQISKNIIVFLQWNGPQE